MKLKARRPFGLKFEIFDPEDGSLLGGGSNRALVSKNASAGIKRATTTDPAALSLGAVREGGIEGKYRVSIFQGNQPLTHESFRNKKNAIAYAVDWKERKRRNIYGFSAKLRLREFSALSDTEKAVFRHYYRKLKKQTRGGEFAVKADSSLLWRGATRPEIESIADNGRFVSNWQTKGVSGTWVTSDPGLARSYAAGHAPKHSRIYAISSNAFKRVNNKTLAAMAAQRDDLWARNVAPLRGGIFQHEVRGILKPFPRDKKRYVGWRPVSLGDVQNRNFSAKLRLRELASIL